MNGLEGPRKHDVSGRPDHHFQPGRAAPQGRSRLMTSTTQPWVRRNAAQLSQLPLGDEDRGLVGPLLVVGCLGGECVAVSFLVDSGVGAVSSFVSAFCCFGEVTLVVGSSGGGGKVPPDR